MDRSCELAGRSPEMHFFPVRVTRNNFNGSRHMVETGIRKQFEAVRKAAQVLWFRLNGWRHTAITRFAQAGVPIATIMARAGHCSPKMTALTPTSACKLNAWRCSRRIESRLSRLQRSRRVGLSVDTKFMRKRLTFRQRALKLMHTD
jgi:integrase